MALPKIDVPVYETTLISSGKKVKFRPFLVKEQKLFMMATESNDIKESVNVIKQVLNNCVLTDIDINSLPTFDIEHLFMQLRARSVGELINLRYNCNNVLTDEAGKTKQCGGLVKFDLNVLDIKPTIVEEHSTKIEITPKLGIVMKYPSFDNMSLDDGGGTSQMEKTIEMITGCIDYIYDEDQIYYSKDSSKEELTEFVENLQQEDVEKIQKFFSTMPKMVKDLEFKCPKCGYEEKIKVEGIQNFFV